eukprot:CAMPEP_0172886444 /NCGR_PEP_ID=MMETSP1075-20121228/131012_1 /TAXON_ID=2916 /ORGANISM="Ceratium fusus, Strain PA161109" /LENGTH=142 /DNA_ID=CAMNT_0013739937 /DNA_START=46 /DNA_END=470 /DNA_ORIENTATION=-
MAESKDVDLGAQAACATWQRTSLMIAARHGQDDVVARFLETSCTQPQLDVVDEQGNTALMVAAREGHARVVDLLIGAGADVGIRNAEEKSAADLAKTETIRRKIVEAEQQFEALREAILSGAGAAASTTFSKKSLASLSASS